MRTSLFVAVLMSVFAGLSASAQDLASLSDEFDDAATLGTWQRVYAAEGWPDMARRVDVNTTAPGMLYLEPHASSWYNEFHAPYLFKDVTGDFEVVARVRVTGHATDTPQRPYSLAGIMARAPRAITPETWTPDGENWVFITTGAGDPPGTPMVETKTTVYSTSTLLLTPIEPGWVQLRLTRTGSRFAVAYRMDGVPEWIEPQPPFDRPDLPATLQVGLLAYTDWPAVAPYESDPYAAKTTVISDGDPDLQLRADYIWFSRPGTASTAEPSAAHSGFTVQAFPAPFRTQATLRIDLPAPVPVHAAVYDVLGRRVAMLADGAIRQGVQMLAWDATDLPAGLYVYRVTAGAQTRSGRLVRVR